ncbi:MAG: class I SAM-dependent methyltransferase [Acidobacteria bacterium]|nr:class I SAM-dependent methyltransferase [Acidobacteriota bacterium]
MENAQSSSPLGNHSIYCGTTRYILPLPCDELIRSTGPTTLEMFLIGAEAQFQLVSRFLPQNPSVLDIGCGCGRIARFLTSIHGIRYVGFDVLPYSIQWCRTAFDPLFGECMRFEHFDGFSKAYNPRGTVKPGGYRFPVEDRSVDLAFAFSVFTHLLEQDARHYLDETKRCLKKSGRALFSIHNTPAQGCDFSGDEHRIDIATSYFIGMASDAGLELVEDLGDICGQHTLLLRRSL